MFAALSINPALNEKVNLFIAMAPTLKPSGLENKVINALVQASPDVIYLIFGRHILLPSYHFWKKILSSSAFATVIDLSMWFLFNVGCPLSLVRVNFQVDVGLYFQQVPSISTPLLVQLHQTCRPLVPNHDRRPIPNVRRQGKDLSSRSRSRRSKVPRETDHDSHCFV